MKVAYVFRNNMASTFQLATMILPQLENDTHGVEVVGMFFFDDNVYCLREGDSIGERLARVAEDRGMLLMMCDQCSLRRGLAEGDFDQCGSGSVKATGTVRGVVAGCFPQLYEALGGTPPARVLPFCPPPQAESPVPAARPAVSGSRAISTCAVEIACR